MFVRSLAVLALVLAPFAVRAANEENPYKTAKVGDYANYKMSTKVATFAIEAIINQEVTAKSEKEATVKATGSAEINGKKMDFPAQEQKIDLTKPYDPTKAANLPGGAEAKIEKLKEGKEKVKIAGKEYDATWTTYKAKMKVMGQEIDADVKAWTSKDVLAGGLVKMTMTAEIANQKMEIVMELTETGSKK